MEGYHLAVISILALLDMYNKKRCEEGSKVTDI